MSIVEVGAQDRVPYLKREASARLEATPSSKVSTRANATRLSPRLPRDVLPALPLSNLVNSRLDSLILRSKTTF